MSAAIAARRDASMAGIKEDDAKRKIFFALFFVRPSLIIRKGWSI